MLARLSRRARLGDSPASNVGLSLEVASDKSGVEVDATWFPAFPAAGEWSPMDANGLSDAHVGAR